MWREGEDPTPEARKVMNKAGRVLFGTKHSKPTADDPTMSPPGYLRTTLTTNGPGANIAKLHDTVWANEDRYGDIDDVVRAGLKKPTPGFRAPLLNSVLKARTTYDDYLFVEMLTYVDDQGRRNWRRGYPSAGVALPAAGGPLRYFDVHDAATQAGVDDTPYILRHSAAVELHNAFSLPVYRAIQHPNNTVTAGELVAYIHLGGGTMGVVYDTTADRLMFDLLDTYYSAIYAIQANALIRDEASSNVRFAFDVVVGLKLGTDFANEPGSLINDLFVDNNPNPLIGGRFIPILHIRSRHTDHLISVDLPTWRRGLDAYDLYKTDPRVVKYKYARLGWKFPAAGHLAPAAEVQTAVPAPDKWNAGAGPQPPAGMSVDAAKIAKMLREGCDGYHYGKNDALSTTVFALAAGKMYAKIKAWYQEPDPLMREEPKAVNVLDTDMGPGGIQDAALITLIQREESKGLSSGAVSSTSGAVLITPLIVEVLGPSEQALSTPCYVDYTYVKTANYRVTEAKVHLPLPVKSSSRVAVESSSRVVVVTIISCRRAQLIGLMYQRIDEIRDISAVKVKARGCLAEFLIANRPVKRVRQMIQARPSTIPTIASLMLQLKTFALISQRTDKGRTTVSVGVAFKAIMSDIFMALFKV